MIFVEEKSLAILIFSGVFCRTKHTKHFIRNPSLTRISPTQSRNHYQNYLRSSELTYIPHLLFFPGAKKTHNPWKNGPWLVLNPPPCRSFACHLYSKPSQYAQPSGGWKTNSFHVLGGRTCLFQIRPFIPEISMELICLFLGKCLWWLQLTP